MTDQAIRTRAPLPVEQAAAPEETVPRQPPRRKPTDVGAHAVLITGSVLMAFPFLWQLLVSLSTSAQVTGVPPTVIADGLHVENFAAVFQQLPFVQQFGVSLTVTVVRTVTQLVLCAMAGYAFARFEFPFRRVVFALTLAILMVPPQVYLISQYQVIQSLGLLDTVAGIILPGSFSAFGAFLMRQFFASLPTELEEAARLDGANQVQVFWQVMLPLARPGLSALAVIAVLTSWNDLLWPLVIATTPENQPLSVGLATLQGQYSTDYPVLMAAALLAAAPILILFLMMQRRVIDGLAFSGMK
jgi:multiple sugar transport system permease protein